ncbi:hypothetical protein V7S43_000732 [Phytophthora oleae]|uniref:RxLR effector protein n=1 Tax=Phytophthora oleae TaxID=2107226 RepID=A0ABD3G8L6_9STRA
MRCIVYIALAIAAFTQNNAVEAFTNTDLSSRITPDFAANNVVDENPRKRFLRANNPVDASDEERTKVSSLKKIIKELDMKDARAKKLAAIKDLAKARKDAQKLAATANVVKSKPQGITTKFSSMEYDNFTRMFRNKLTPEKAKSMGKIKSPEQLARYEDFYEAAKAADILKRMAHA